MQAFNLNGLNNHFIVILCSKSSNNHDYVLLSQKCWPIRNNLAPNEEFKPKQRCPDVLSCFGRDEGMNEKHACIVECEISQFVCITKSIFEGVHKILCLIVVGMYNTNKMNVL